MTEEIQQQEQAAAEHVEESAPDLQTQFNREDEERSDNPAWRQVKVDKIIQDNDIPKKMADDIMPGKYGLSVQQRIQKGKT